MGSRCYDCGEKFGRCYEHAGNCPDTCTFGNHDCAAAQWHDFDLEYPEPLGEVVSTGVVDL